MKSRKKLIEVALPLEAINEASSREKSIRYGHPSTLHLWWSRKPLATARAVIFAQIVDDPSANPDLFPTGEAQEKERKRLFKIIEDLVQWENTTNEAVLQAAHDEISQSWRRACEDNKDHPRAKELFNPGKLPAFYDPFAGGGALPLEAQRLGLEAYASDLNPVAVLINKAIIEIPPKFAGKPAVNPESQQQAKQMGKVWLGAQGLAEDVRYYGKWMRDEAEKRIGHLYPKVEITAEMAKERPDLTPYVGKRLTVIAWLWVRTVKSPNPAFADVDVPLASTFMLSNKAGKEVYFEPVIEGKEYHFTVKVGKPKDAEAAKNGTKLARGAFKCLMSGSPFQYSYIDDEANAGRMGVRLRAVVAEGERGRVYLSPTSVQETIAQSATPTWKPEAPSRGTWASNAQGRIYGFRTFGDYFTPRQLEALTTFSDLVQGAREQVERDAMAAGVPNDGKPLRDGGTGAKAYAEAVGLYLAFAIDRMAMTGNSLVRWNPVGEKAQHCFGQQGLPMFWDFAEPNFLGSATGSAEAAVFYSYDPLNWMLPKTDGVCLAEDATVQSRSSDKLISTDPPYYDNVGYADLSDFFYVWLRHSQRTVFPELFSTLSVPKAEELIATAYRHGSREKAESFFLDGMTKAMHRLCEAPHPAFPITIYYAFKQSESEREGGTASTGWETFLDAVIRAGFCISGTWPIRTEMRTRRTAMDTNALASSIALVCRAKPDGVPAATRREFITALKAELPGALAHLQRTNIAPVDIAQAAIGPGMAVYTRFSKVLDASGQPLSVREALLLINQTLDDVLAEQEGDFDADTRWALAWFEQAGFTDGEYGIAETLSKAKNTSIAGLEYAGILKSKAGKVRLLRPEELSPNWDPITDSRLTVWEAVHHLIRKLEQGGEAAAADLAATLGGMAEIARELAYRLYTICERKKRAQEALSYNALVQSWPEISRLTREGAKPRAQQAAMFARE